MKDVVRTTRDNNAWKSQRSNPRIWAGHRKLTTEDVILSTRKFGDGCLNCLIRQSEIRQLRQPSLNFPKYEFELHEGHAFGNDGKGKEVRTEKFAEVIDRLMIDLIDTQ
jgi:hypothetical protein